MKSRLISNALKWLPSERAQALCTGVRTGDLQTAFTAEREMDHLYYGSRTTFRSLFPRAFSTKSLAQEPARALAAGRKVESLLRLISSSINAANALEKWTGEGRTTGKGELKYIVRSLRKSGKYDLALQVFDWMQKCKEVEFTAGEYAIHMDLIAKVHGMDRAEKYFRDLSKFAKTHQTYTTLLHCYVKKRQTKKAEKWMEKIQELGFATSALPYNDLIALYMENGQVEKVPSVVKQMKKLDILPDTVTYNMWMRACVAMSDITGVEKIVDEIKIGNEKCVSWINYSTLANIYIKAGLLDKAGSALKETEKNLPKKENTGYRILITMYAALGNREEVHRIWRSLKMAFGNANFSNYQCMLSSLVKVGDIEGAERIFKEWEILDSTYDPRMTNILLAAYINNGMLEKAETFHNEIVLKGGIPNCRTWEILTEGYIESKQMEKAGMVLKNALSKVNYKEWTPKSENVMSILKHFEEQGNIEGIEEYLTHLRRIKFVSTEVYKLVLSTYFNAGRAVPGISEQIAIDNVSPDEETSRLLKLVNDKS